MAQSEYCWFRASQTDTTWNVTAMPTAPDVVLSITSDLSLALAAGLATEAAIRQAIGGSTHPLNSMICRVDARKPDRVECWYKN
ncbi:MAG: hypothetical protein JNM56_10920 [Planctomycetia bacterium]|nr:hypothetical protein [Planctomycetia bacterium]